MAGKCQAELGFSSSWRQRNTDEGRKMPENEPREEDPIIKVTGLEHSYGTFKAVNGISFAVKKGEIFSFLGPTVQEKVQR